MMELKKRKIVRKLCLVIGVWWMLIAIAYSFYVFIINRGNITLKDISAPDNPEYEILFLRSYNSRFETYHTQENGIRAGLYGNDISYDVLEMDYKNYGTEEDVVDFYEFAKKRITKHNERSKYDAVLLADDAALRFAMRYQDELFPEIPIVFYGINSMELAEEAVKNPYITGYIEYNCIEENLSMCTEAYPDAKTIVAIVDDTLTGQEDAKTFLSYQEKYPDLQLELLNYSHYDKVELATILSQYQSDTILILMDAFRDKNGEVNSISEAAAFFYDHLKIPIFRNYEEGMGKGILGGIHLDYADHAQRACTLLYRILKNPDQVRTQHVYTGCSVVGEFDYSVMKKFGLTKMKVPENSVLINSPENLWEKYREILLPVIMVLLSFIHILIVMSMNVKEARDNNMELQAAEIRMQYNVEHDFLLGIYNRYAAERELQMNLKRTDKYAIVIADIDNFKEINENYGHGVGDAYLKFVAGLLNEFAESKNVFIARYGGDEFLMILTDQIVKEGAPILKEIQDIFRRPMEVGMENIQVTVSLGVVNSDSRFAPEDQLMYLDMALNVAKEKGKNRAIIYEDAIRERIKYLNHTKNIIVEAIQNDGFHMLYQPKVSSKTNEVVGFEALVRMSDASLSPGVFIPIAEQNGLIRQIGRITTELTVKQLAIWRDQGYELKPVSINFSSLQVNDEGYVDFLIQLLNFYKIEHRFIQIEITESLFMEKNQQTEKLFAQLEKHQIDLLMDDFGTGYSGLSSLTYVPAQIIKLDKSLVDNYLTEEKDVFLQDLIQMLHHMGKRIVVEGVEHRWQFERLREFEADDIQGYYFSKPLAGSIAINWKP